MTTATHPNRFATVLAALLFLLPSIAAIAQPTHVVLTDADERLRCGAGTAYYPVSQPAVGTVLPVRNQTDNGWFEVAYPSNVDAIVPAAKARIADDGAVVLTEPDRLLALHSTLGPAASWAKLLPEPLPAGTRLFPARGAEAREGERWLRVRAPSAATGFVRVNAVRPASRAEINEFLNPAPVVAPEPVVENDADEPKPTIVVPAPVVIPNPTTETTTEAAPDPEPTAPSTEQKPNEPTAVPEQTTETPEPTPAAEPAPQTTPTPTTNPFAQPTNSKNPASNPFAPQPTQQQATDDEPQDTQSPQSATPSSANPFAPRNGQTQPSPTTQPATTQPTATEPTTTQPTTTEPTPEPTPDPTPEPAPLLNPAELDRLFSAVRTQPTLQAEFDQLISQYDRTIAAITAGTADFDADETTRETLETQRTLLGIRQTIQRERLENINAAREATQTREAAESETRRFVAAQPYDVVGRLQRSIVYDGAALPALYRVVSIVPGEEGLALAYLQDSPDLRLSSLVGRTVGLRGEFQTFAGGAVRLLQAETVNTVDPNTLRIVPSTNR